MHAVRAPFTRQELPSPVHLAMFTAVLASVTGAKGTLSNDVSRHGALEQEKGAPSPLPLPASLSFSFPLPALPFVTCGSHVYDKPASLASRSPGRYCDFQRIYTRAPGVSSAARLLRGNSGINTISLPDVRANLFFTLNRDCI